MSIPRKMAIILYLSQRRQDYGLSILRAISDASGEDIKTGSLYPSLTRLTREGVIEQVALGASDIGGGHRTYHRLTEEGKKLAGEMNKEIELLQQ